MSERNTYPGKCQYFILEWDMLQRRQLPELTADMRPLTAKEKNRHHYGGIQQSTGRSVFAIYCQRSETSFQPKRNETRKRAVSGPATTID